MTGPGFQRLPLLGAIVGCLQAGKQVAIAAFFVLVLKSPGWILVASLAGFAISIAYHAARWLTFQLSVDAAELKTSHVFITRTERRVPIASIHDLLFEQSLLQRVFGVVTVRVETAGGSGTEAELDGLLRSQAEALKAAIDAVRLRQAAAAAAPAGLAAPAAEAAQPPEQVVAALGLKDLVAAGLSSATIWIVGGALFSAWFFLDDLIPGLADKIAPYVESVAGWVFHADPLTLAALSVLLLVALLCVAAVASVVRTCVRYWGFRATWNGVRLSRSCGLFTKRRQVLQVARIQRILVRQSLVQRMFRCVSLELGTAAVGSRKEEDRGRSFTIPIVRNEQLPALLAWLAPSAEPMDGAFDPVSPLAGRRYLIRSAVFLAVVSGLVALWSGIGAAIVWTLYLRDLVRAPRLQKVGGSRITPSLVQLRSGAFSRRLVTIPLRRVQGVELTQSVFDRMLRLAHLRVSAAGGGNVGQLGDIPQERARSVVATIVAEGERAFSPTLGDLEKTKAPVVPGVGDSEFDQLDPGSTPRI